MTVLAGIARQQPTTLDDRLALAQRAFLDAWHRWVIITQPDEAEVNATADAVRSAMRQLAALARGGST